MDGAVNMVKEYHQRNPDIKFPDNLQEKCGASLVSSNPDAWITAGRVVDLIRKDLSKIFINDQPIPVLLLDSDLGEEDGLFILINNHHAFVVLYFAKFNFCLIADGENSFAPSDAIDRG